MDKLFRCEECDVRTTTLRALVSHYRNKHGNVPESCKALKENAVPCPNCGLEVKNLTRHNMFCSVHKMSGPLQLPKRYHNSPSAAMASLQLSVEEEGDVLPETGPVSDDQFFELFKKFCVDFEGNKESTFKQYSQRLKQFTRYLARADSKFEFGKSLDFQSCDDIDNYFFIPSSFKWVNSHSSNENKAGAVAAYIKVIDFYIWRVGEMGSSLKKQMKRDLKDGFEELRSNARSLQKKVSANILPDRKERKAEAETLAEDEEEIDIPMDKMKELVDKYRNCNYRNLMYKKLNDMDDAMNFGGETPVKIRNFLMLEVLFESGGQRPETIRNIQIGHLYNADVDTEEGQMRVINVTHHKTSKHYGPAKLIVPEQLYVLLVNYCKKVRGRLAVMDGDKDEQYKNFLFVAQGTGEPLQNLDQSCKVFVNVTETKYKIFPKCFRYLAAYLGQADEDPKIREKLPHHMNHSQSTAQLHYVSQDEKRKEHSRFHAKVWGRSENLPTVSPLEQDFEEDKAQMNAAKKAKMDAAAAKKDEDFVAGPRKVFSPSEKDIIVETFKDVPQSNLKRSDFDEALKKNEKFKELVENHKDQGKTDSKVFTQVQNSFRAARRK